MKPRRIQIGAEFMWCQVLTGVSAPEKTCVYRVKLLNTPAFDDRYQWGDTVRAVIDENGNFQLLEHADAT